MTPRERAESVINVWPSYDSWKDEEASMLAFVEAVIADAVEADRADRVVSDIHDAEKERDELKRERFEQRLKAANLERDIHGFIAERDEALTENTRLKRETATAAHSAVNANDRADAADRRIAELHAKLERIARGNHHPGGEMMTAMEMMRIARAVLLDAPAQPATVKEHCPRRLMGETLAPHAPCDTGDHSKDAQPATAAKDHYPEGKCKWCESDARPGDNICEPCRGNMAAMSDPLIRNETARGRWPMSSPKWDDAALPSPAALPLSGAKLTPAQEENGKRDVALEDAAENEAPSSAAREHDAYCQEWARTVGTGCACAPSAVISSTQQKHVCDWGVACPACAKERK